MSKYLHEKEGDDELRALVDQFFEANDKKGKKVPGPTKKLQLPPIAPLNSAQSVESVKLGLDELEKIRMAFLGFQNEISDTALYPYLYSHIEKFADTAALMESLIQDDIDIDSLSAMGMFDYVEFSELRMRILDEVLKKYKTQGE